MVVASGIAPPSIFSTFDMLSTSGGMGTVVIDPATDSVIGDIPVGGRPGPIAIEDGAAWVGNGADRTVVRIDLRSRSVVKSFGPSQAPVSLTAGPDVAWIGNGFDGTLSRILTGYDQLSAPLFPGLRRWVARGGHLGWEPVGRTR